MSPSRLDISIRDRLRNLARKTGQDFIFILTRFGLERLLYRVGISAYADQFLLKGALLFDLWFDVPHRPTRDIDFLGFGSAEIADIEGCFRQICSIEAADGITFHADSVLASEIRNESNYPGARVTLRGSLAGSRISVQIDIGFGDAVSPAPEQTAFPVLLDDLQAPSLRVYPRYSVVAEKVEAIVQLGMANSRMKDYFDLFVMANEFEFDGGALLDSIQATFARRETPIPANDPVGLTADFAKDRDKIAQWQAFLGRNTLQSRPLENVIELLHQLLMPILNAAREKSPCSAVWQPGGPWKDER